MGFDAPLRAGLKLADTITGSLQLTVQHAPTTVIGGVVTRDANGRPAHGAAVPRQAVVDTSVRLILRPDGRTSLSIARVMFPRPVTVNVEDIITLPNGTTAPIIEINGPDDPSTAAPFFVTVTLGQ